MGELFERMLSPVTVNRAWRTLRGDRALWTTGVPRADIERDVLMHVLRLLDEVRAGHYRPESLRRFTVKKGDGGQRVLSALVLRDKLLQKAAQIVLDPIGESLFHPDSHGYRRGRGVDSAHARAAERVRSGLGWLVDADIRSFFDRIPHNRLLRELRRHVPDAELRALIGRWLEAGSAHASVFGPRRGIAQGGVISPFLCNLYLHSLDTAWQARNLPFVRYADDFLLFTPDRTTAEKALAWTATALKKLGLELHPDKTRVTRSGPHVVFLGRSMPRAP
ncbi:MAG: Retron-type reverse transcriptase [Chromatiales bacterium]|nr:Retron-type reverse transcriptase [Chromatiales bacterium]